MAQVLLCKHPCRSESIGNIYGLVPGDIRGIGGFKASMLLPNHPYLISPRPSATDRSILAKLNGSFNPKDLFDIALDFGAENAVAIAEIAAGLRRYGTGAAGVSTGIYGTRMESFAKAITAYQQALLDYRQAVKTNSAGQAAAKQKVIASFEKMQAGFRNELSTITARTNSRKGHPLNNSTRALNIARSSRNVVKLDVMNQAQASNLMKFGQYGRYLGTGIVAIDFAGRVGNVHNSYKAGDNWEREMFIESLSFAGVAFTGLAAAKVGSISLLFLTAATPVGWVGLIFGGLVVACSATAVSISLDKKVREEGGTMYDRIMKWFGTSYE